MWNFSNLTSRLLCALISILSDKLIIFYTLSWCLIRYTRWHHNPIPYLNNWLTDFVYVPIICAVSHWIFLHLAPIQYARTKYPLFQILILVIFVSIVFEFIMPNVTEYNTYDLGDILSYLIGGLFYYIIHQNYIILKFNKT